MRRGRGLGRTGRSGATIRLDRAAGGGLALAEVGVQPLGRVGEVDVVALGELGEHGAPEAVGSGAAGADRTEEAHRQVDADVDVSHLRGTF